MRARPLLLLIAALAAVAALATVTGVAGAASMTSHKAASIHVRRTKVGRILVDARGRTLYLFMKDKKNKSECAGACAKFWPPLMTSGRPRLGRHVEHKLVGTIARRGGRQVTYDGHPLYTFIADKRAGQMKGQGLNQFGALWWVVAPNGHKITKR